MVDKVYELTSAQLEKITRLSKTSLHCYIDGFRFAHIREKMFRKKIKYPSGVTRSINIYPVTIEDIEALRRFKSVKLRHNGILDGIY